MIRRTLPVYLALAATAVTAEESRQLDAHVHGTSNLNIAIDGQTIAMELHAPGADIVGFEHAAKSAEDRDAVATAVAALARPLDLFVVPAAAGCTVTQASAELEIEDDHDDHGHDHEEHAEHGHEEHAEHDHEEHGRDDDHAAHEDHEDHAHGAKAEGATHSEFHAEYTLNCAQPSELTEITFAFFDTFKNAQEVDVQIVSQSGAQAFEVERDAPTLGLQNLF